MITYKKENITNANEDIIICAANAINWMGGILCRHVELIGIAESINFKTKGLVEKEIRKNKEKHKVGDVFFSNGHGIGNIGIIHAITMYLPGGTSKIETIKILLPKIVKLAKEKNAKSIAIPYLGCGTGGLKKEEIKAIYEDFFKNCDLEINVYYL